MGRIRRGNHLFLTWKGDHGPRHVHVYEDDKMIKRVLALIRELQAEGLL